MVPSFNLSNALPKTSVANENTINILEESQVRTTEERKVKNYSTPHPPQLQRERERERHLGGTSFDLKFDFISIISQQRAVWMWAVGWLCSGLLSLLRCLLPSAAVWCVLCWQPHVIRHCIRHPSFFRSEIRNIPFCVRTRYQQTGFYIWNRYTDTPDTGYKMTIYHLFRWWLLETKVDKRLKNIKRCKIWK